MENKNLTMNDMTEQEKKILVALRDPVKGPKIREVLLSNEQELPNQANPRETPLKDNIDDFERLTGAKQYADMLRELHGIPTKY